MKKLLLPFFYSSLAALLLTSCFSPKRLITDEVVLKDGNSQTGTLIEVDSTNVRIKKMDESMLTIKWTDIDTIRGLKLKTAFAGINTGVYNTPYFSVFRNERMNPTSMGMQFKTGFAMRGVRLHYLHLTVIPARPYAITKFGLGYQYYTGLSSYVKKNAFFIGMEANLMGVKYNNGPQLAFETFTGYERKLSNTIRMHAKLQFQFNFSNKNNRTGVNFTVGFHFMRRNLTRYYKRLNSEHIEPYK